MVVQTCKYNPRTLGVSVHWRIRIPVHSLLHSKLRLALTTADPVKGKRKVGNKQEEVQKIRGMEKTFWKKKWNILERSGERTISPKSKSNKNYSQE